MPPARTARKKRVPTTYTRVIPDPEPPSMVVRIEWVIPAHNIDSHRDVLTSALGELQTIGAAESLAEFRVAEGFNDACLILAERLRRAALAEE